LIMAEEIVTLATLTYSRAQILKNRLDESGIECDLIDANVIRSTAPVAVKVQVNEKDFEEALRIALIIDTEFGQDEIASHDVVEDIDKILVPIDYSVYSKNACEYALGIAERLNAEIMLFHSYYFNVMPLVTVAEPFTYQVGTEQSLAEIKELAEKNMMDFYLTLKNEVDLKNIQNVRLNFRLTHGIPEEEILNYCNEYNPGVIIMGTRGHSADDEVLFGNVTTKVVEDATVPVLTIPEISKYQGINRTNILYATNFDKSDIKAIRKLLSLVYEFDVKIYCVHIGKTKWDSVLMENLKEHFDEHYSGYEMECALIEGNDVLKELQKFIDDKRIDIIAMNTHKRNFITRFLNPSLTRRMLFHTQTPLLVFHA